MSREYAELRDTLAQGDVDLGVLTSDEVAVAVGVAEDPSMDAVQLAALATAERSLVARGLVDVTPEGLALHGVVGLVRIGYLDSEVSLAVDHVDQHAAVYRLAEDICLHERVTPDGVHTFALTEWRRGVTAVLAPTVDRAAADGESRAVTDDELRDLVGSAPARAAARVLRRTGEGTLAEASFGLLRDADGATWFVSTDHTSTSLVAVGTRQVAELVDAIASGEAAPS